MATDNLDPDTYHCPIDHLSWINTDIFPEGFEATILHQSPYIVRLKNFFTDEESKTLIDMGYNTGFSRSTIVVDDKLVYSTARTSVTSYITENGQTLYHNDHVDRVIGKVCALLECNRSQIENLMVVRYNQGEKYNDHHDYFEEGHNNCMGPEGQRYATFFGYLAEPEEGGETEFPLIGVKAAPIKNSATFWWNKTPSGKVLPLTTHRGNPVGKGTKFGLNIWIRENGW